MTEMRLRPKSDYLEIASWESIYVLTEHWKSEMDFFRDELRFLSGLISKYFIWMTKEENITTVQEMANNLKALEKKHVKIAEMLDEHLSDVGLLMENAFSHDEQEFRDKHVQLEEDLAEFTREFRKLKKEIFRITEHVIESEKLQHLLMA